MTPTESDQQAAERYARINAPGPELEVAFLAGVLHARSNPSPEVLALVECLASKCMCYDNDDVRASRNPCEVCRTIAAFKASGGGHE